MSILNLRPSNQELNINEIPYILEQLNIDVRNNNNNRGDHNTTNDDNADSYEEGDQSFSRRSLDDRALAPRISSLENSLVEHINSSVPTLDELVIRQRGRKKQPAKISWSPIKSPFKTPTKRNSTLHMSLLSPSPAKQLFNNSAMTLRSSPRKRILVDTPPPSDQDPTTSSPLMTPTKRMKFFDVSAINNDVPLQTLLKGLNQDQLIKLVCDVSNKDASFEESVRKNLPQPDLRSFEEQLCTLRKNITRTSPRSRLMSRTDGAAFSRAASHLIAFKKAIVNHCKVLNESQQHDALIEYILMAWTYVRALPIWDEVSHNIIRKECFKVLAVAGKSALKHGGMKINSGNIASFRSKLKTMMGDYEDIGKCQEALHFLSKN